jgi:ubiquinone/menaquinone biosynthesis C-methylase UbiE
VEGGGDGGDFFAGVVPALFAMHWPDASWLAERIPAQVNRVLDLGAGSGVWSLALAKLRSHVRVVAVDRRKVLDEVTSAFLTEHGVLGQYELRAGDYHAVELEPEGFDLVYLGHLLHADGWALSRNLLSRAFSAISPGGYLAVAEILASEPRSKDYAANVFDLNMLMLTENGVVFTAKELVGLLTEAGFESTQWMAGPGDYPILLARKGA